MLATLFSFLGGAAFRLIWADVSDFFRKRQEFAHELAMLQAQREADAERHRMQMEAVRVQAEAGVQIVRVQAEGDVARTEADAFLQAVKATSAPSGVAWIDGWNAAIRPGLATMMALLIALHYWRAGWTLDQNGWELAGAVIGVYVADRLLFKRGR